MQPLPCNTEEEEGSEAEDGDGREERRGEEGWEGTSLERRWGW